MSGVPKKIYSDNWLDVALEAAQVSAQKKSIVFIKDTSGLPKELSVDKDRLSKVLSILSELAIQRTAEGTVRLIIEPAVAGQTAAFRCCIENPGTIADIDKVQQILDLEIPVGSWPKSYLSDLESISLRMASKLVEIIGGKLECKSAANQPTRFFFSFGQTASAAGKSELSSQAVALAAKPAAEVPLQTPAPSSIAAQPGRSQSAEVLIVDDVSENRMLAEIFLKKMGHHPSSCINGQQAVELCAKQKYDVILMDIQMPVLNGLEATRRIRKEGLNTGTFIIAMTASDMPSDEIAARQAGCNDSLAKPIEKVKLGKKITAALGHTHQAGGESTISFLEGNSDYQKNIEKFVHSLPKCIDEIKAAIHDNNQNEMELKLAALKRLQALAEYSDIAQKVDFLELSIQKNCFDGLQCQLEELAKMCLNFHLKKA